MQCTDPGIRAVLCTLTAAVSHGHTERQEQLGMLLPVWGCAAIQVSRSGMGTGQIHDGHGAGCSPCGAAPRVEDGACPNFYPFLPTPQQWVMHRVKKSISLFLWDVAEDEDAVHVRVCTLGFQYLNDFLVEGH